MGCPRPFITIASCLSFDKLAFDRRLIIAIAFSRCAKLNVKRFCSFLASAMTFLSFINVIMVGLLWYVIPLSQS